MAVSQMSVCEALKPPPLPPVEFPGYNEIIHFINNDDTFKEYAELCNVRLPVINTGSATTDISTQSYSTFYSDWESTVTSTVAVTVTDKPTTVTTNGITTLIPTNDSVNDPSTTFTPSTLTSTIAAANQSANTANVALPIVLTILFIAIAIALLSAYWWWRKRTRKRGSANVNSLPLKEYENTNYLANKALAGQCWKGQTDKQINTGTQGNQYGSFPPSNGEFKVQGDVKVSDEVSSEGKEGIEKIAYLNENFEAEDDGGARSPGVDSQTPLCDMIDGVLPNMVLSSDKEIQDSKTDITCKTVEVHLENGNHRSSQNMTVSVAVDPEVILRSPKKKKKGLSKSTPVEAQVDKVAPNRKTV